MNIEESLWNYIDGACSPDEQKAITLLIESDEAVKSKYNELLSLNRGFSALELDEPPMAFTYNIMETIRTENAMVPLKATINKRIIRGIAAFFILSIVVLLVYILANISWPADSNSLNILSGLKLPNLKSYLTGPVIQGFLFFDVVLGLFLMDSYLRKRNLSKKPEASVLQKRQFNCTFLRRYVSHLKK